MPAATLTSPPDVPPGSTVSYGPRVITLDQLLPLMARYGATLVRMPDGLEVHLPRTVVVDRSDVSPLDAPAKAPCGHELYEQSDAGCLHGCPVPEAPNAG